MRSTLLFLVSCVIAFAGSGCTFLLDFEECTTDDDCGRGVCIESVCEVPSCDNHDACNEYGAGFRCIRATCVQLDTNMCTLDPGLEADTERTLHIGALFPYSGSNATKARATATGAKVALKQINNNNNGVRGVRLSMVECDTENNAETAVEVARYMTETLGLQSIIGSISSDETIDVAQNVTIDAGTVLVSPASTSPQLSRIEDNGLVWRTIASDALQGPALAKLVTDRGFENLMVLNVDSAYGDGLFSAFTGAEEIAPGSLETATYTVAADGSLVIDSILSKFTKIVEDDGFQPDAIVVLGSVESQQIIFALDDRFFGDLPDADKPTWVLSEAGRDPGLLDDKFSPVWDRIIGTVIATIDSPVRDDFAIRFEGESGLDAEDHPFADKAYDAAFLLGLAHGATEQPIETPGGQVAARLKQTAGGEAFAPGDDIKAAIDRLSAGSIDYQGASGPVDFDPDTGDVQSDIQAWSIETDMMGENPEIVDGEVIYEGS
jgi:ABC-type branched-subunit amino acid transport system substrate-binding protein